jgi:hypothetical protein
MGEYGTKNDGDFVQDAVINNTAGC